MFELIRSSDAPIKLIMMPSTALIRPSIALGLLKQSLADVDLHAKVVYANLMYAEELGIPLYRVLEVGTLFHLPDWIFSKALFPDFEPDATEMLNEATDLVFSAFMYPKNKRSTKPALMNLLRKTREESSAFIRRLAASILASGTKIVGCTSVFQQHVASLALLKTIRELDPSIVTVMGGSNCQGIMGVATLREFPFVDYVFTGESDEVFPLFCQQIFQGKHPIKPTDLPAGVITHALMNARPANAPIPWTLVNNLDNAPIPDYDDYISTLQQSSFRHLVKPGWLMETSRGCWWAEKKPCTFCALNGQCLSYRSKSPERVVKEIQTFATRYGAPRIDMTDNILDMTYFKTVLPQLARVKNRINLFYETKSNLSHAQVEGLHQAGVTWFQPGIESFHDDQLRLMNKGVTATKNIQTLKYATEYGLRVSWVFLVGFPGEQDQWLLDTATWLPLVYHLFPPIGVFPIIYQRFSEYHDHQEKYGMELTPSPFYRLVYPLSDQAMHDLAYYFDPMGKEIEMKQKSTPGIRALRACLHAWRTPQLHDRPKLLCMTDHGDHIDLYDTRPCAPERNTTLTGLKAAVYRACEPAVKREALADQLQTDGHATYSNVEIKQAVDELKEQKIVLDLFGSILSLAIPGSIPDVPKMQDFPGGHLFISTLDPLLKSLEKG